eukprot:COSAG02_NODE_32706_length_512_cov_0.624697_2_plen_101_part_01
MLGNASSSCVEMYRKDDSAPSISIGINYIDDWNKQRALLDTTLFSLGEETPDQVAAAAVATALLSEGTPGTGAANYGSSASSQQLEEQGTERRSGRNGGDE